MHANPQVVAQGSSKFTYKGKIAHCVKEMTCSSSRNDIKLVGASETLRRIVSSQSILIKNLHCWLAIDRSVCMSLTKFDSELLTITPHHLHVTLLRNSIFEIHKLSQSHQAVLFLPPLFNDEQSGLRVYTHAGGDFHLKHHTIHVHVPLEFCIRYGICGYLQYQIRYYAERILRSYM